MLNYNVRITSLDAGNIFINGDFIGLIDNKETFNIDLMVGTKNLVITKEPISNKKRLLLPYTVIVKTKNGLVCDSEFANIIPFGNNNYDIVLQPCDVKQHESMQKAYDDYVSSYNLVVVNNGQSFVNLYDGNVLKYSSVIDEISTIVAEKRNNYIIIKGINKDNKKHVLILDENNGFNELINCSAEQIDETEHEIKVLTKLNDIAKHANITVLNTQNNELNKQYYVYLNGQATTIDNKQLVPYAFLEAIKIENFTLAKTYLSDELHEKTTKKHLKTYFKNLKEIHYNTHQSNNLNNNVVNYTLHCNSYRSFNFHINSNNKIEDIEEISF